MPVEGQPVPISGEELARAQDEVPHRTPYGACPAETSPSTPPCANLTLLPLSGFYPRLRVDSAGFGLSDHSEPTQACAVVPPSLVTRVLELAHAGPNSAHLGYKCSKEQLMHLLLTLHEDRFPHYRVLLPRLLLLSTCIAAPMTPSIHTSLGRTRSSPRFRWWKNGPPHCGPWKPLDFGQA